MMPLHGDNLRVQTITREFTRIYVAYFSRSTSEKNLNLSSQSGMARNRRHKSSVSSATIESGHDNLTSSSSIESSSCLRGLIGATPGVSELDLLPLPNELSELAGLPNAPHSLSSQREPRSIRCSSCLDGRRGFVVEFTPRRDFACASFRRMNFLELWRRSSRLCWLDAEDIFPFYIMSVTGHYRRWPPVNYK